MTRYSAEGRVELGFRTVFEQYGFEVTVPGGDSEGGASNERLWLDVRSCGVVGRDRQPDGKRQLVIGAFNPSAAERMSSERRVVSQCHTDRGPGNMGGGSSAQSSCGGEQSAFGQNACLRFDVTNSDIDDNVKGATRGATRPERRKRFRKRRIDRRENSHLYGAGRCRTGSSFSIEQADRERKRYSASLGSVDEIALGSSDCIPNRHSEVFCKHERSLRDCLSLTSPSAMLLLCGLIGHSLLIGGSLNGL